MVSNDNRRKFYSLTAKGMAVLCGQIERLALMTRSGKKVMEKIAD